MQINKNKTDDLFLINETILATNYTKTFALKNIHKYQHAVFLIAIWILSINIEYSEKGLSTSFVSHSRSRMCHV